MTKELTPNDKITEFLLYRSPNGEIRIEVFIRNENVWLTQKKMAELFGIDRSVITKHLSNIFESGELDQNSACAKIAHTAGLDESSTLRKFRTVQKEGAGLT